MQKNSSIRPVLATVAILALALGIYHFHDTYPLPGNRGELSDEEIRAACQTLLDTLGIELRDQTLTLTLESNERLLTYAQRSFGVVRANQLFADELPAFYWKAQIRRPMSLGDIFRSSKHDEEMAARVERMLAGETTIHLDVHGRLLLFHVQYDSAGVRPAPDSTAALIAINRLRLLSPLDDDEALTSPQREEKGGHAYWTWKSRLSTAGVLPSIRADFLGPKLVGFDVGYQPVQPAPASDASVQGTVAPFVYIGAILAMAVFFFRKLRGDRISLRAGLPTGVVCAVLMVMPHVLSSTEPFVQVVFPIIFVPAMAIFGFMMTYGIAESVMRDRGRDQLRNFESLQRRQFLFQPLSESLWNGVLYGAVAFGAATLLIRYLGARVGFYMDPLGWEPSDLYVAHLPALAIFSTILANGIFGETVFRLFVVSFFQRYVRSTWLVAILASAVAASAKLHLVWMQPLGFMLAVSFVVSLLITVAYLRHDFLAAIIAAVTVQLFYFGMSFLYMPSVHSIAQASVLLAVPVLFLVGGAAVRRFGTTRIDERILEPDYVQRLAERERMIRELEIARQVQASFLPRSLPEVEGLDLASLCVPANEVGGDYYDFIPFSPTRLGVLIGDVSGKGISAAFYMTLTKGIVKTLVREGLSPRAALIRANQLFYENAERGTFVSLVFGIFDLNHMQLVFARAGHNPLVIASSDSQVPQMISPGGLALGLEPGEVFARHIEERIVPLNRGDLFVFYTDGFTEAMNHGKEEFGETRFAELVREARKGTSRAIIDRLYSEVKRFAGRAPQHDDMTAIIVKVR